MWGKISANRGRITTANRGRITVLSHISGNLDPTPVLDTQSFTLYQLDAPGYRLFNGAANGHG